MQSSGTGGHQPRSKPAEGVYLLDRTASRDDLLLSRAGDLVDCNVQLNRNVTRPENLDLLVLANGALGHKVEDCHVAALGVELGELLEVHDLVLDAERVLKPAQLRLAHDEVQVAALEPGAHRVARLGALGTATRSL